MVGLATFSVLALLVLSWFLITPITYAHLGTPIDSSWATICPTIDGNVTSGEWSDATVRSFTMEMRSRSDGSLNKTLNGVFYVKNNWTELFLAIQIFNDDYAASDGGARYKGLLVLFDDNHTGVVSVGDNGEGVTTWKYSPLSTYYSANDLYYAGGGSWTADVYAGMTNDGAMAWSHTNPIQGALGNWTFEMMIPLVGTDGSSYDFNITSLPKTVGFKIWFEDFCNGLDGVYPDDPSTNINKDEALNGATFGDLTIHPLYTLTINTTMGGTTNPTPGDHQYPYNTVVSVTATPDMNYVLHHWELDSVNVGNSTYPFTVTMDQNHTLKAVFWPLYTLTTVATTGGTTNPAPGQYKYLNGTVVSVTATQSSGYEFDHWELDSVDVGTANPYSVTMDQNHTLKAVFVSSLSVTISPTAVTIHLGDSVTFTSSVSGGTPPYTYQWYLGTSGVGVSPSWTFTPASTGTYTVHLNVTDSKGRVAISNTATVVVITPTSAVPVGGVSFSLSRSVSLSPLACYAIVLAVFATIVSLIRRKRE